MLETRKKRVFYKDLKRYLKKLSQAVRPLFRKLLLLLFFLPFFVTALEESNLSFLYDLLKKGVFYTIGDFQGENKHTLRYAKFGKGRGKNGSLVFVNGKGENLLKYIELFYDLYLQGWSPIYTYDHRGQGFSNRILSHFLPVFLSPSGEMQSSAQDIPDAQVSYVEEYSFYRKDMEAFIRLVLNDREVDRSNLFLISHSMGGAIVLDYLQIHGEKHPFKSIVFSAPMIKIKSNLFSFLESTSLDLLTGYCSLLPCTWRIPSLRTRFTWKTLTNSQLRYAFSEYLTKQKFPQAASKGTSFRWVVKSFEITKQLMEKSRIRRIVTPFIILQSEQERFVSNEHQDSLCEMTPHCCHIKRIAGKHEFFLEKDEPRNQAIQEVAVFFLNSEKHQKECQKAVL